MVNILAIKNGRKVINNGMNEKKVLLDEINLTIREKDFITILGGSGAGKDTLFNTIVGTPRLSRGSISSEDQLVTKDSEGRRARLLSRVFQNPKIGTAPRMTIAENLLLAQERGQKRKFRLRNLKNQKGDFFRLCQKVGSGLEQHSDTPTDGLSDGQRQALSLLMATITAPELLLLDEHTAALDPRTAKALMQLTDQWVNEQKLTHLMIAHRMEDALKYGNHLIVPQRGKVVQDISEEEKQRLTMNDLLQFFEEIVD